MADKRGEGEGHDERPADTARARLAVLQGNAADAYTAIRAADAALGALAERRVAAERVLRHAAARHQAASRAAAAHARAKPGPLTQLATRFRARREWRERRAELENVLRDAGHLLAVCRRALSQVKDEFSAQVRARAEAVTALRRLTVECAAALEQIAREQPAREHLAAAQPSREQPAAAAQPVREQPARERPAFTRERPAREQPAGEQPAREGGRQAEFFPVEPLDADTASGRG